MMENKEYIEREALLDSKHWLSLQDFDRARAKVIILGRPAADVVEVRHGEWIHKNGEMICSVCGNEALMDEVYYESSYCPDCGAKMDGKGEE